MTVSVPSTRGFLVEFMGAAWTGVWVMGRVYVVQGMLWGWRGAVRCPVLSRTRVYVAGMEHVPVAMGCRCVRVVAAMVATIVRRVV